MLESALYNPLASPFEVPRNTLEEEAIAAARRNGGSLFYIPRSLQGVWQNSDATGIPTLGGPVGFVENRAGSGSATQSTTANKPTLVQLPNGQFAISFDGGDGLGLSGPTTIPVAETFIWAGTIGALGFTRYFVSRRAAASGGAFIRQSATNAFEVGGLNGSLAVTTTGAGTVVNGTNYTVEGLVKSGQQLLWVGGLQIVSGTSVITHASTSVGAGIGCQAAGDLANPFLGFTALAFWAPTEMPTADRQAISRYGAWLSGASYVS